MDALAPPAARAPFDAWLDAALRRLAPISPWAMTLLTMRPDAEGTDRALARLIASDPALLARVLGAANARPFNPQAHQVIDVAHAIRRLGTREVWRIATVLALGASARIRPELRPAKRALWAHSFTVAHAARGVAAAAREGLDADRVFVAGLLHDIGLMVLLSVEPQRCVAMLGQVADPAVGFSAQLERDASLPPHARVGGEVCRGGGLPGESAGLVAA
ncbi:MAG: HDOD domain-containing protein, partial [Burkholderiales bacterium]